MLILFKSTECESMNFIPGNYASMSFIHDEDEKLLIGSDLILQHDLKNLDNFFNTEAILKFRQFFTFTKLYRLYSTVLYITKTIGMLG